MQHDWVPSTLGHGEQMCARCYITNREAAALGQLNECSPLPETQIGSSQMKDGLVRLDECPVGLFMFHETLCLKTEYRTSAGKVEAYIVESGEFFAGAEPDPVKHSALMVKPIDYANINGTHVVLDKRPVAFRLKIGDSGHVMFEEEALCADLADKMGTTYEGLYTRSFTEWPDRYEAGPSAVFMKLAENIARADGKLKVGDDDIISKLRNPPTIRRQIDCEKPEWVLSEVQAIDLMKEAADRIEELERSFHLRWKADRRATLRWQAANPGNDLTWPDHADLVVWLMERLEALDKSAEMVMAANNVAIQKTKELAEAREEIARYRKTLEIIAGQAEDKLQATQAKGVLG